MKKFPTFLASEFKAFRPLNTPAKIQDFLDGFPINFEKSGETSRSPLMSLKYGEIHCMEGAYLASAILWFHGRPPLIMNMKTTPDDIGHAVALFKQNGRWGAISKTNHAVLRYRDPIYETTRELAASYFNEYFRNSDGKKTLRKYSKPFSMLPYGSEWLTSRKHLWDITFAIDDSPHFDIMPKGAARRLRRADNIEILAGKITEWKRK